MHIDLQQEVHTSAKVKTEIHRQSVDLQQPLGGVGNQVGRDDVGRIRAIGIKRAFKHFAGLKLLFSFRRIKAHTNGVLLSTPFEENAVRL